MYRDHTYQPVSSDAMGSGMYSAATGAHVTGSQSQNYRDNLNSLSTNMRRIDIGDSRANGTPNQGQANGIQHAGENLHSGFQVGATAMDMHQTPGRHSNVSAFQSERKEMGGGLNISRTMIAGGGNNEYMRGGRQEKLEPFTRPLFEGNVPVNIREVERESRQAILHIKISIYTVGPQRHQSLRIELTDESDPFFLYAMDCGETEFHILKTEQNLLVDFQTFPDKFIELLNLCGMNDNQMITSSPKFLCVLHCSQSEFSEFNVVETNQFKHLTHLALKFRSGNDESLKKYLAQQLKLFKSESEEFRARYENSDSESKSRQIENEQLNQEILRLKNEMDRLAEELRLEEKKKLNEQKEQMLQSQDDAVTRLNDERETMMRKFEAQVQELAQRNKEYTQDNQELNQNKLDLESKNRELSHDLSTTSHELDMARNELNMLRDQNKNLDTTKYSQEKSLSEITLKNTSLERQLEDKEQIIQKLNSLLENTKAQKDSAEENANMFKANSEKLEDKLNISVREINKGNTIIQELQNDINNYKAKLKQKNLVLKQQEQEMESRRSTLNDTSMQVREMQAEIDKKVEELRLAESTNADLHNKLEESRKIIESNTNMIQWLNKSLSDAQKPASHYLSSAGAGHVPSVGGGASSVSRITPGIGAGSTLKGGFSSNYSGAGLGAGSTIGMSSGYSAPVGGFGSAAGTGAGVGAGATFKPTYSTIEEITSKTATLTTSPNVRSGTAGGDYMNHSTSTPGAGVGTGTRPLGNSLLANSNPPSDRKGNDIRYSPYSAASATSLSTNEVQGSAANYMNRVKSISSASSVKSEDQAKRENPDNNMSDAILPIQYRQPNA